MDDLLKDAIADAKAVRETALENAKIALEEAFTPRLQSMLSKKIQSEIEDEDDKDIEERGDEDEDPEERMDLKAGDEDPSDDHSEEDMDEIEDEEEEVDEYDGDMVDEDEDPLYEIELGEDDDWGGNKDDYHRRMGADGQLLSHRRRCARGAHRARRDQARRFSGM